jgi:putative membrane protein
MKHSGLVALACAVALTVGCNGPRTDNTIAGNTAVGTSGKSVSDSDAKFVNEQLTGGTAEVDIAKMAKNHATSPEVKQFAAMMIEDHTNAAKLLRQMAITNAIPLQAEVDKESAALIDKLFKLHGAAFDKEYMKAMIDEHEEAVRALRARVDENRTLTDRLEGKNPEDRASVKPEPSDDKVKMSVNEWAANVLPTVEHHLDRAKEIRDHLDHPNSTARADTGAYRSK